MMNEIRELLLNARQRVAIQVNTELLSTYWNVGRIIVEHEQENKERADYGKQTLKQLSKDLTKEFGKGFSVSNLQFMRRFYQSYQIQQTVSVKLSWSHYCELLTISDADKRSFYEKEAEYFYTDKTDSGNILHESKLLPCSYELRYFINDMA